MRNLVRAPTGRGGANTLSLMQPRARAPPQVATCISRSRTTVKDMIGRVRQVARELVAAQPVEVVIGNVARRVLHIIREEVRSRRPGPALAARPWCGCVHALR